MESTVKTDTSSDHQVIDIDPKSESIPLNQLHPTEVDEEENSFEKLEGLEDGGKT